jgi:hypothetical protein
MHLPNRGRVAKWTREQINRLSTPELRALLENAERLKEIEVAALCNELLDTRPRGRPAVRRDVPKGVRRLVSRSKAFELHGVIPANRVWSRGGIRSDGAVVLTVRADEVHKAEAGSSSLLWAPNIGDSHPWSDTPGGRERLEHCRIALERGTAQGLLIYGTKTDRVDPEMLLELRVEKRGEEYWASWTAGKRVRAPELED